MGAALESPANWEEARTPVSGTRKRGLSPTPASSSSIFPPYSTYDDAQPSTPTKKARKPKEEKRLRRFRSQPPQSFGDVYTRATTQRFYVLSRKRVGTEQCPEETVEMTGSTGNIYTVTIARQPTCDCPQGIEGKQCKHIVYVLLRVLHAKADYVYQLALLSTELQEIFANAPPPMDQDGETGDDSCSKKRKPVEGDCPICFGDMEAEGEAIVWCRAACGQNIHKECFEMWAATKRQQGSSAKVTCPYCRSVWEGDEDMVKKIEKTGGPNEEGYLNVADQLGISQERDTSTYSRFWPGHYSQAYRRRRYY